MRAWTAVVKENVKLTKVMEEDDMESYLTTFECMMANYEISQEM